MKKFFFVCVAAFLLAGCGTKHLTDGLKLMSQEGNIEQAVSVLGIPDGMMQLDEQRTVYVWGRRFSQNVTLPATATAYGTVGTTPFSGQAFGTRTETWDNQCTVKIVANKNSGAIVDWSWEGNEGGCEGYGFRLKKWMDAKAGK